MIITQNCSPESLGSNARCTRFRINFLILFKESVFSSQEKPPLNYWRQWSDFVTNFSLSQLGVSTRDAQMKCVEWPRFSPTESRLILFLSESFSSVRRVQDFESSKRQPRQRRAFRRTFQWEAKHPESGFKSFDSESRFEEFERAPSSGVGEDYREDTTTKLASQKVILDGRRLIRF